MAGAGSVHRGTNLRSAAARTPVSGSCRRVPVRVPASEVPARRPFDPGPISSGISLRRAWSFPGLFKLAKPPTRIPTALGCREGKLRRYSLQTANKQLTTEFVPSPRAYRDAVWAERAQIGVGAVVCAGRVRVLLPGWGGRLVEPGRPMVARAHPEDRNLGRRSVETVLSRFTGHSGGCGLNCDEREGERYTPSGQTSRSQRTPASPHAFHGARCRGSGRAQPFSRRSRSASSRSRSALSLMKPAASFWS